MLTDIEETIRGKGATCWNCKSADVINQWGDTITYDSDVENSFKVVNAAEDSMENVKSAFTGLIQKK